MKTNIDKAPACLNMNDKAMWVTGWNEAIASMEAQQVAVPQEPNNNEVICPNCCTQFRAIPANVQRLMLDAGFEPPFMTAPQPAYVPLSDAEIASATRQELDELMDFIYEYGTAANGVSRRVVALTRAIEQAVRGKT